MKGDITFTIKDVQEILKACGELLEYIESKF